jgi:hypothetical protein
MAPPPNPPRRPGSSPELQGIITPDQPERGAVRNHPGVDGAPIAPPVPRKLTSPGGFVIPRLPGELSPTLPAENPLRKKTWRVPTPPSAVAQARRSDPPTTSDQPATTDAPQSRSEAREAILEAELAEVRHRLAQSERDRRAEAEARQDTFPPKVETRHQRSPSPVPSSTPDAKLERAVGGTVVLLAKRFGWPAIAVALGIAGVAKPAADPGAVQASKENTEALRAEMSVMHEQLTSALKWMAAQSAYTQCIEESLDDMGEQVLPAQDKLANPTPLRAYIKRCRRLRP